MLERCFVFVLVKVENWSWGGRIRSWPRQSLLFLHFGQNGGPEKLDECFCYFIIAITMTCSYKNDPHQLLLAKAIPPLPVFQQSYFFWVAEDTFHLARSSLIAKSQKVTCGSHLSKLSSSSSSSASLRFLNILQLRYFSFNTWMFHNEMFS